MNNLARRVATPPLAGMGVIGYKGRAMVVLDGLGVTSAGAFFFLCHSSALHLTEDAIILRSGNQRAATDFRNF